MAWHFQQIQFYKILANNNDNFSKLNFNWNNLEEGQFIIDTTIKGVLNNVRNVLINNIDGLAQTIEYKNQNKINSLKTKIELLEKLNKENDQKKLKYLTEHLKIAKKLKVRNCLLKILKIEKVKIYKNSN